MNLRCKKPDSDHAHSALIELDAPLGPRRRGAISLTHPGVPYYSGAREKKPLTLAITEKSIHRKEHDL